MQLSHSWLRLLVVPKNPASHEPKGPSTNIVHTLAPSTNIVHTLAPKSCYGSSFEAQVSTKYKHKPRYLETSGLGALRPYSPVGPSPTALGLAPSEPGIRLTTCPKHVPRDLCRQFMEGLYKAHDGLCLVDMIHIYVYLFVCICMDICIYNC